MEARAHFHFYMNMGAGSCFDILAGLIVGLRPANERRLYFVTTYLIGWVQAYNQPYIRIPIPRFAYELSHGIVIRQCSNTWPLPLNNIMKIEVLYMSHICVYIECLYQMWLNIFQLFHLPTMGIRTTGKHSVFDIRRRFITPQVHVAWILVTIMHAVLTVIMFDSKYQK